MHGSGAGIVAALLKGGATEVTEIRSEINPAFPGMKQPEPVEDNLAPLISAIKGSYRHSGESRNQRGGRRGGLSTLASPPTATPTD